MFIDGLSGAGTSPRPAAAHPTATSISGSDRAVSAAATAGRVADRADLLGVGQALERAAGVTDEPDGVDEHRARRASGPARTESVTERGAVTFDVLGGRDDEPPRGDARQQRRGVQAEAAEPVGEQHQRERAVGGAGNVGRDAVDVDGEHLGIGALGQQGRRGCGQVVGEGVELAVGDRFGAVGRARRRPGRTPRPHGRGATARSGPPRRGRVPGRPGRRPGPRRRRVRSWWPRRRRCRRRCCRHPRRARTRRRTDEQEDGLGCRCVTIRQRDTATGSSSADRGSRSSSPSP